MTPKGDCQPTLWMWHDTDNLHEGEIIENDDGE